MSNPITELTIVPEGLPPSLILASTAFLTTLAQVETQARELKITDPASAQLAASLQIRLTDAGSALEKQRKALKAPFIAINARIDEAAKAPAIRIETAKSGLKLALVRYDDEQRRLAEQARQAREAEERRLQAIRQKEIEAEEERRLELERAAQAAAAVAPAVSEEVNFDEDEPLDLDEAPVPVPQKTETQIALEKIQHAPVVAAPKPAGISFRVTLTPVVLDVNKLPDMFCTKTPNLRAIIATFCAGYKEGATLPVLDGVRFDVTRTPVSTGKTVF